MGTWINEKFELSEVRMAVIKLEDYRNAKEQLKDANLVFIELDLSNYTKINEAKALAKSAKNMDAVTIGIVATTYPSDELHQFKDGFDSIVAIPFGVAHSTFSHAVSAISGILKTDGENDINLDLDDLKMIIMKGPIASMGVSESTDEQSALNAMQNAFESARMNARGDKTSGVLVHFNLHPEYPFMKLSAAMEVIYNRVDESAEMIFGTTTNENLPLDYIKITVIATGFEKMSVKASNNVL